MQNMMLYIAAGMTSQHMAVNLHRRVGGRRQHPVSMSNSDVDIQRARPDADHPAMHVCPLASLFRQRVHTRRCIVPVHAPPLDL